MFPFQSLGGISQSKNSSGLQSRIQSSVKHKLHTVLSLINTIQPADTAYRFNPRYIYLLPLVTRKQT